VKDDLLVLGVSHHLRISRQTKKEKWLMPHIRPGCCVDYGVGRIFFVGEAAGF
jgi:hypothetical protein